MGKLFKEISKKRKEKWILSTKQIFNENIQYDFHIEIQGNREFTLEGCNGVYEYGSNFIKLQIKKGYITICGNNFDITNYEGSIITIKGKIDSFEFSD